ncbi:hypothetical protein RhiirA4_481873, partial [Rhizophagus irregularis]
GIGYNESHRESAPSWIPNPICKESALIYVPESYRESAPSWIPNPIWNRLRSRELNPKVSKETVPKETVLTWIPESQYFEGNGSDLDTGIPMFRSFVTETVPIWIPESQSFDFETLIAYLCMQKFIGTNNGPSRRFGTDETSRKDPQDASELMKRPEGPSRRFRNVSEDPQDASELNVSEGTIPDFDMGSKFNAQKDAIKETYFVPSIPWCSDEAIK